MTTVVKNVRIMQTCEPFEVLENQDVVVQDDTIAAIGIGVGSGFKADRTIDGSGCTLMPGNVCSHHHYYSGLSRGMLISAGPQTDFIQVLKEWWWRLDRGLDEEACYYSSLICSLDAIACGTTACVDHHASPNYIRGSLSTIAKGMEECGLRGVTCYEVTDRNGGMKEVEEGVEENVRFAKEVSGRKKPLVGAMIGGHAPFTLPDEALRLMGEAVRETGRGMHLHVAEDKYDVVYSHHFHGKDIVRRLEEAGLIDEKTLLVHALHLSGEEIDEINRLGAFVAHNPRSNMNNHVGYLKNLTKVDKLVIGTDGCGGNMFEEVKIGFFKHKDEGGPWWPADFVGALSRGNRLLESCFADGRRWGRVAPGYVADLVLLDYRNPTPLVAENAAGHFVWGMGSGCVKSVIIDGRLVYDDRHFVGMDVERIYREAARVAARVWKTVDKIKA